MSAAVHPFGTRSWAVRVAVQGWGLFWRIGGRDPHYDSFNLAELVFFRDHEPHCGWRVSVPLFEGGLRIDRGVGGKWEAWVLQGPWRKVR